MSTQEEQKEFYSRYEMLRMANKELPECKYYGKNDSKDGMYSLLNGERMELKWYEEIIVFGDHVVNVSATSVDCVLRIIQKIIVCPENIDVRGYLGRLL